MDVQEVIIAAGLNCGVYNAANGSLMQSYRLPQNIHPRTLTLIGEDFLFAAISERPSIKIWTLGQKANVGDMVVPGKITALCASNAGQFLFAGIGKELYVWKIITGELLGVVQRHYQEIMCIKCSADDSHIVTGGKDGHVYVWTLDELVDATLANSAKKPLFTWTGHTAEVTDIHVTSLCYYARVATVSSDMTCKLYELSSGELISTICMDAPLSAVTMDTLESFVFIGDQIGAIHRINLFEILPKEIHASDLKNSLFSIHKGRIVSLHVSFEGTRLISASEDKTIRVWDMESFSVILKIPVDGTITNAFITLKPTVYYDRSVKPLFVVKPLNRSLEQSKKEVKQGTKTFSRKISSMPHVPPELCYNPSIIHQNVVIDKTKAEASRESLEEKQFQITSNEPSVTDLSSTNNQLYSLVACEGLDILKAHLDSESIS